MTLPLWDKVDVSVLERKAEDSPEVSGKPRKRNWRRLSRAGGVLGALCWGLALTKLFIFDFDRYFADKVGPPFDLIVQFRFLVILGVVALLIAIFSKAWALLIYIGLFPLIFLFWTIPSTLVKFRSWNLILAIMSLVSSWFHRFKLRFLIRSLEVITCVVALFSSVRWLSIVCACLLGVALIYRYVMTVVSGIRASKFSMYQEKLVGVATKMEFNGYIEPELKSDEVVRFTKEQLEKFSNTVSNGLVQVKVLSYYAELLRQYRKSQALVFLNLLSYAWLFVQSAILLTLINLSVYVADADQFRIEGKATLPQFFYYATTALYGNTIPQISASGDVAVLIASATALYGPIFVLALGLQVIASFRHAKDDVAFSEFADRLKTKEIELSRELQAEYEMSPDEVMRKLEEMGNSTGTLLAHWVSKLPTDLSGGRGR